MICHDCVRKDAELETARELAYEAVEARDIGRAALRLMEAELARLRRVEVACRVVFANRPVMIGDSNRGSYMVGRSATRCLCGCDPEVEALRSALTASPIDAQEGDK